MKKSSEKIAKKKSSERSKNWHSILSNEEVSECKNSNEIAKELTEWMKCKEKNSILKLLRDTKEALDVEEISIA